MSYVPQFDLAFVIHYTDGSTIHGRWNSNVGYLDGQKMPFAELCEAKQPSSVEVKVRHKENGQVSRYTLSVPNKEVPVKYVMLFRGMIGGGFGQVKKIQHYEQDLNGVTMKDPVKICVPSAISMVLVALEKTDDEQRGPLEAYKTYPVLAKVTVDTFGDFMRTQDGSCQ